jgi:squalene synthase HpnC
VALSTDRPQPGTIPDAASVLGQAGSENFPVASWLLPAAVRSDLLAIYGFARLTDDIGDESPGDRLAELDWLEDELRRAAEGRATHPLVARLTPLLVSGRVPIQPFVDLIEANRLDQRVDRYETFDDLLGYCRLSAAPVGRMVLGVLGAADPERVALADQVCNGLQVVEHIIDVGEDARRGRVYLPQRDLAGGGVTEDELLAGTASPALRRVVAVEVSRARRLLAAGAPLSATLRPRPRLAVAGFAAGGLAALDAVVASNYDVLGRRCRPARASFLRRLVQVVADGRSPRGPAPSVELAPSLSGGDR